jgi:hypothetical protein
LQLRVLSASEITDVVCGFARGKVTTTFLEGGGNVVIPKRERTGWSMLVCGGVQPRKAAQLQGRIPLAADCFFSNFFCLGLRIRSRVVVQ